ncbi:MAG TPA: hypothetical protein VLA91_13040 [Acidimicrobiia bacterium]|nr:hypothetical protein [Acidimicrobiia bacterium]
METTPTTTPQTTTTTVVTTTTTVPEREPAPVDVVAWLPDEATLQDGVWAVVVFRQSLECIPAAADLATETPADCDHPVIFTVDGSDELIGENVPVWLVRWPVLAYAMANGSVTRESLGSLPSLLETTSDSYSEGADGSLEVTGRLPGGEYLVEVDEATMIDVPLDVTVEPVALSDLTGMWESETHVLQVDDGGTYELLELRPDGSTRGTDLFGFIALQDGLLIFPAGASPGPCSGETGVYFGEVRDGELYLAAVDEPCALRQEAFEAPWSLPSAG